MDASSLNSGINLARSSVDMFRLLLESVAASSPRALAIVFACVTVVAGLRSIILPRDSATSFGFPREEQRQMDRMPSPKVPSLQDEWEVHSGASRTSKGDSVGAEKNPFITVLGYRSFATALTLLALVLQKDDEAVGILLSFNAFSMLGDAILCIKRGVKGSANHHLAAAMLFGGLGGWFLLRA